MLAGVKRLQVFKYIQPNFKGCMYLYFKPTTGYSRELLNIRKNLPGNLLPQRLQQQIRENWTEVVRYI